MLATKEIKSPNSRRDILLLSKISLNSLPNLLHIFDKTIFLDFTLSKQLPATQQLRKVKVKQEIRLKNMKGANKVSSQCILITKKIAVKNIIKIQLAILHLNGKDL